MKKVFIMKAEKLRFVMVAYFIVQITFFVSTIHSCKITREGLICAGREEKREVK
jgi:hypothetical protein